MKSYSRQGIRQLFNIVPETYELINHVLTFGLDIYWRKRAAAIAGESPASRILDCCSGTGEFALALHRRFSSAPVLVAGDFSRSMLTNNAKEKIYPGISSVDLDAEDLPFIDGSMDLVTVSFGVRNINRNPRVFNRCLSEFHRILRKGGRLLFVETSQPKSTVLRSVFHWYVRIFVEHTGAIISGSRAPYRYLSHTIPRFHDADTLSAILTGAGFEYIRAYPLTLGVVCIHDARRL